jgi:hypothetical protein
MDGSKLKYLKYGGGSQTVLYGTLGLMAERIQNF